MDISKLNTSRPENVFALVWPVCFALPTSKLATPVSGCGLDIMTSYAFLRVPNLHSEHQKDSHQEIEIKNARNMKHAKGRLRCSALCPHCMDYDEKHAQPFQNKESKLTERSISAHAGAALWQHLECWTDGHQHTFIV